MSDKQRKNRARPKFSGYPPAPWLSIWSDYDATMRAIVRKAPDRYTLLLIALAGLSGSLIQFMSLPTDLQATLWYLPISVVLFSMAALYINGWILTFIASLFGGRAKQADTRAVLAWSTLPATFLLALLIPAWLLQISVGPVGVIPTILYWVQVAASFATLYLFARGIALINRFSFKKTIVVLLSPVLLFAALFALIFFTR